MTLIQDLHAAISRRDWHAVEVAANVLRDQEARPAAPVEGLETVGYVTTSPTGAEVFQRKPLVPGHGQFGYKQDAVVTRSQAEELLAAERAETMRQVKHWSELYKQQHYRAEKAEAIIAEKDETMRKFGNIQKAYEEHIEVLKTDNAALTARVKELEKVNAKLCDDVIDYELKVAERDVSLKALETQLAAAEKALEYISGIGFVAAKDAPAHHDEAVKVARAALEAKP